MDSIGYSHHKSLESMSDTQFRFSSRLDGAIPVNKLV